ncbi:MAG: ROK family transcriptional regulator [Pseudomonadota bacterium]
MTEQRTRRIVGSNAERTRLHNRQVVLGHIRQGTPMGRAQIARASGLSTQAVSNIISELHGEGLLQEAGRRIAGRGLPAVQYTLNPEGAHALGIEVRPDAVFAALVDLAGTAQFTHRVALTDARPEAVGEKVIALRQKALDETGRSADRLLGCGVVMPGPFGETGLSHAGQSALTDWAGIAPETFFEDLLGLQVTVENDATAAAVAERVSGVAADLDTFCFLYFGTGLGLGFVSGGQLQRGAFGNAGEIGHMIVEPGGRPCACGNQGCLETYVSRLAIRDHLAGAGVAVTSGSELEALYRSQSRPLMDWLDSARAPLAQAVGLIENLLDPQTVILGGAMPDILFDHLIMSLDLPKSSVAARPERDNPRVMRGASGRFTAALGGAALVINQVFTPRIAAEA